MRPSPVYCETGGVNMNDYLIEDELLRDQARCIVRLEVLI